VSITSLLSPVDASRMSSQIVAQVVALIREGRLAPGDRLPPERELATTFGVSRVTVRDALRTLDVMGLLDIRVGSTGGAFVTTPSPDVVGQNLANILMMRGFDPEHIAETRLVLELGIFDLVAARVTDDDIAALRDVCRRARQAWEGGSHDTALSFEFHHTLAQAAHNPALEMLARSFAGPLSMVALRAQDVRSDASRRTVEEHEGIVEALAADDADRARATLIDHLLRGRQIDGTADRLLRRG
jgi:GntR family transcriptional repressor for pyruvate dehydrogenase complex